MNQLQIQIQIQDKKWGSYEYTTGPKVDALSKPVELLKQKYDSSSAGCQKQYDREAL